MNKECLHCWIWFEITQDDLAFYDKISPVFGWKKYQVSAPTHCPDCRQQRRLAFRNERKLYKTKCAVTWKNIISIHSPDSSYKIYEKDEWWSDNFDWTKYWIGFDFNKWFFQQFKELVNDVPRINLFNTNCENSDYWTYQWYNKNCYLEIWSWYCRDCYYWTVNLKCNNCTDCFYLISSEKCYNCIDCDNCYNSKYLQNCSNCSDSYFCYSSKSLKNCFLCYNLSNKQHCIENKQYTKEEYFKILNEYDLKEYTTLRNTLDKYKNLKSGNISKFAILYNCDNCTWDNLHHCSNSHYCFDLEDARDCKFCYKWEKLRDSYDANIIWLPAELCYECLSSYENCYNQIWCCYCWNSKNIYYSDCCFNSENLFWCVGLKNKKYCILNMQFSKEEYDILVPRIIEHMQKAWEWWEFFPITLSPFAYNETMAQDYFPLSREWILHKGWRWKIENDKISNVTKVIPAEKLPNSILDIPDDVLNWAIKCEISNRPYKIIPQELKFYRENNISIPHLHPDERLKERIKLRNPRKLHDRQCMKCDKDIQTTYAPERSEIVYCEECYLKELY